MEIVTGDTVAARLAAALLFLFAIALAQGPEDPVDSTPTLMVQPWAARQIQRLAFTRDGKALMAQGQGEVTLHDVERGLELGGLSSPDQPRYFTAEMGVGGDFRWYSNPATLAAEKRDLPDQSLKLLSRLAIGRPGLRLSGASDSALLYRRFGTGEVFLVPIAEQPEFVPLPAGKGFWTAASRSTTTPPNEPSSIFPMPSPRSRAWCAAPMASSSPLCCNPAAASNTMTAAPARCPMLV